MQQSSEAYMKELREDHGRFSRILSMIGRDARRLEDEPKSVLPLFAEAIEYVVGFQNVYHHPREEIMFAKIAEKSASFATIAAALSREHLATDDAGEALLSMMKNVSAAPSRRPEREELARKLEDFARLMRRHISKEEELLYSQAWAELAAEDWQDLADSVSAVDPLEGTQESRFPLLAEYVSQGRKHSDVSMDGGTLGKAVASGLKQADKIGLIHRTMKQQRREAWALTKKSIKAMPLIPILQPERSLRAGSASAVEFGRSYMRWLRQWGEVYQDMRTEK